MIPEINVSNTPRLTLNDLSHGDLYLHEDHPDAVFIVAEYMKGLIQVRNIVTGGLHLYQSDSPAARDSKVLPVDITRIDLTPRNI